MAIGTEGELSYVPDHSVAGDWVTLRADLDLLLVMSTAPHALATAWAPPAVRVEVADAQADDGPRLFRDESARALAQSALVTA